MKRTFRTGLVCLSLVATACGGDAVEPPPPQAPAAVSVTIEAVRTFATMLTGTPVELTVAPGPLQQAAASLEVYIDDDLLGILTPDHGLAFTLDSATHTALLANGPLVDVSLIVTDGTHRSNAWQAQWSLADTVPLALSNVSNPPAYYGDAVVLVGDGFLAPTEGVVTATLQGTFTGTSGATPFETSVPVVPAEAFSRGRGTLVVPTQIGGLQAGDVDATLTLSATSSDGSVVSSTPLPITFSIAPPTLFRVVDDTVWLGEALALSGGGFVDETEATTTVRLQGTFTTGGTSNALDVDLVLDETAAATGRFFLRATPQGDALTSDTFGVPHGAFSGTATLTITAGTQQLTGEPAPIRFDVLGVRQTVWLRFQPDFYGSLTQFGLSAAAGAIEAQVQQRVANLYANWAVDVRLEEPIDVEPSHITRIDIGGPDPNGIGLFGFDNTPGKDVNNLRLFDVIGGANFETQQDGYPGYGGVFIESMLWWASDPPSDRERPAQAPGGDPAFDAIFTPLFETPASPAEVAGQGTAARNETVADAVSALSNAIGETVAHELGHSLGLAAPASEGVFHNNGDGLGCLMDHGADRPFGERAGLPGFAATRWCGDAEAYLDEILPLP